MEILNNSSSKHTYLFQSSGKKEAYKSRATVPFMTHVGAAVHRARLPRQCGATVGGDNTRVARLPNHGRAQREVQESPPRNCRVGSGGPG